MRTFQVSFTGDYLNEDGELAYPDMAPAGLNQVPYIRTDYLRDIAPTRGDPTYWDRLYELEIQPQHVARANAIVIFRPWVKASAFAQGAAELVAFARAGAGVDKINLDACTANDVAVFNAPDSLTHSTASSAFLFMLALAKRLPEQERMARSGCWEGQPQIMGDDLVGKTLGIAGLGKSGTELARLARAFGMRIIAFSPSCTPEQAAEAGVILMPTLEQVLRESDFFSLHSRLSERTRRMIGERELRMLKPSAFFINVARGEMVDQPVLVRALRERWFAGAGLDVFEVEPAPAGDPILALDNVILTPHWLPATRYASRGTMQVMVAGILAVRVGKCPTMWSIPRCWSDRNSWRSWRVTRKTKAFLCRVEQGVRWADAEFSRHAQELLGDLHFDIHTQVEELFEQAELLAPLENPAGLGGFCFEVARHPKPPALKRKEQARRIQRSAVQGVGGAQEGQNQPERLHIIVAAQDPVSALFVNLAPVIARQVSEQAAITPGQRKRVAKVEQHPSALLRMRVVINAAADVVDHRRQAEHPAMGSGQIMQGAGEIQQLARDMSHAVLMLDGPETPMHPPPDGVMLVADRAVETAIKQGCCTHRGQLIQAIRTSDLCPVKIMKVWQTLLIFLSSFPCSHKSLDSNISADQLQSIDLSIHILSTMYEDRV